MRYYINNDWQFISEYDDSIRDKNCTLELEPCRIPHTVAVTPFDYFNEDIYQMVSGYRRIINIPAEWTEHTILLTFEGAAHDAVVFVNGIEVGCHHTGYTAFTLDISKAVTPGDNVLAVRLDSRESLNTPPFGFVVDYMTYGGIYRDVYLEVKEDIYIDDEYIYPLIEWNQEQAREIKLAIDLQLKRSQRESESLEARISIADIDDSSVIESSDFRISGDSSHYEWKLDPERYELWHVNHPKRYEVKTEILEGGRVLDERIIRTGLRSTEFRTDGFYLNGRKLLIRGLNRHQSYPYVGYAMPESIQRMDARVLKEELGLNAVRTSHYPQSHYFLDECDRLGLLVFTEMPGWQHIGDEAWKEQALDNIREMIVQYRNHPSIMIWGVRINESRDDDEFYERTNRLAHKLDPYRPTGGVKAGTKMSSLEDVYTYNDFSHWDRKRPGCMPKRKVTSDMSKPYMVTEYNGHVYPTKAYDTEEHRMEHALRHADVLNAVAESDNICGSFGWCMADYNTHKDFGSGDRICYHGVMDMYRNPKMAALVYEMQQEEHEVLDLSSSMDIGEHPGCNRGDTYIFSNADSVRVYKNDRLLCEYRAEDSEFRGLKHGPVMMDDYVGDAIEKTGAYSRSACRDIKICLNDCAKHGMGGLTVRGKRAAARAMLLHGLKFRDAVELYNRYVGDWGGESTVFRLEAIRDGRVVKTVIKEPATELDLDIRVSDTTLTEDISYDVAAIRVRAIDQNGNQLPFCNEALQIRTEGPIEIIGPEIMTLRGGMGGTYVRTTGETGNAKVLIGDRTIEFKIIGGGKEV